MEDQSLFNIVKTFQILWGEPKVAKSKIFLGNSSKSKRICSKMRKRGRILSGLRAAVRSEVTGNHPDLRSIGLWTNVKVWILEESKYLSAKPAYC